MLIREKIREKSRSLPGLGRLLFVTDETEYTRRVLVDTVGDAVDVDSYGVAMECQGFINGFRLALELCR